MIIQKTIKMKVNGTMVKKYREMGYDVKQHDFIDLPIEKLSKYSHQYILCACDECGEEKQVKYNNYCKYIEKDPNNKYTCKKCNYEKRKNTCKEKYGVENVSQSEKIKKKKVKTMKENGTDHGFRTKKYKNTMLKEYGAENPSQNEDIKKKKESTCLKNYYVKSPSQSSKIRERMENTCLKNYGVKVPFQSEQIKEKVKKSNLEKYGVEYISQVPEIHKKQMSGYVLKHHTSGLYYRGSYELDFIKFCEQNNIFIENFSGSINYNFNGKQKTYFPDFYLKKLNLVIEIKSKYTYEFNKIINEAKKEATINNGFNFMFIIDKDYSNLLKIN